MEEREFPGGLAVKDLALLLLWLGFNPWPRNICVSGALTKEKKKKRKVKKEERKTQINH